MTLGSLFVVLNGLGINARLKWPNDLWVDELKLAGLLIELQGDQDQTFVVMGIELGRTTVGVKARLHLLLRQIVFGLIR